MKNKNGFTLVELMAVIVVLAIIIAIAVPSYSKINMSIKEKSFKNKVSYFENAATKYAEDTNILYVFVDDLIKNGYIEADDEEGYVYDPRDKSNILNCYIVVTNEENNMLYSKFIEENHPEVDEKKCDNSALSKLNGALKIKITDINGEVDGWTKNDVILTAEFGDKLQNYNDKIISLKWYQGTQEISEYSKTSDIPFSLSSSPINPYTVTTNTFTQQLYTVDVVVKDGETTKRFQAVAYVQIDKVVPKFYTQKEMKSWATELELSNLTYDDESGLYGRYLRTSELEQCSSDKDKYNNKKIILKTADLYYVCAMDNVGNISAGTVKGDKIDNVDPSCTITFEGTSGDNDWYIKDDVKIKLTTSAAGLSGLKAGMSTSSTSTATTSSATSGNVISITSTSSSNTPKIGTTYYGYVVSGSGKIAKCNATLKHEKTITAPVKESDSFATWNTYYTANYTAGAATSGIASKNCNRTDSSGTVQASGTVSGENCTIPITLNSANVTYYSNKCIKSTAGNSICSSVTSKTIQGYCTAGNYTSTSKDTNLGWGTCSKSCGSGTQYATKRTTTTNTSTYNGIVCSTPYTDTANGYSQSCNTQTCCSSVKYTQNSTCSNKCGGGRYQRTITSNYDGSSCGTDWGGTACGGSIVNGSYTDTYSTSCPTACGKPASTITGTRTQPMKSTIDGSTCNAVTFTVTKSCAATEACYDTYSKTTFTEYVNEIGNGNLHEINDRFIYIKNYTKIEYTLTVTAIDNPNVPGICEIGFHNSEGVANNLKKISIGRYDSSKKYTGSVTTYTSNLNENKSLSDYTQQAKFIIKCFSAHTSTPVGGWNVKVSLKAYK